MHWLLREHREAEFVLFGWKERQRVYEQFRDELTETHGLWDGQVELQLGDVGHSTLGLDEALYEEIRQRLTHMVHLAEASPRIQDKDTLIQTNVIGSENAVFFASQAPNLEMFIHLSDMGIAGVGAESFSEDSFEHSRPFRGLYERTKYEAEESVRMMVEKMPICIVRTAQVVDEDWLHRVTGMARLAMKIPGRPGVGDKTPMHMVDAEEAAENLGALLFHNGIRGRTFHLVDPRPSTGVEVFREVARQITGREPRKALSRRIWSLILSLPILNDQRPLRAGEVTAFYQGASSAEPRIGQFLDSSPSWTSGLDIINEKLRELDV